MLRNRSVQILIAISLYLSLVSFLPDTFPKALYAISMMIKDTLLWILPMTVCFFIASAISSFERKAPLFLFTLLLFEAVSNSACIWYAYGCSHLIHLPVGSTETIQDLFTPLWRLPQVKPTWWSADKGVMAGVVLGLIPRFRPFLQKGKEVAEQVLTRGFSKLIPLFILGFIARMDQTNLLSQVFSQYAGFCLALVVILSVYIGGLFVLGNGFSWKAVKNLMPAAGMAFSSGCSLSTMPWTIEGASKNMQNPDLAKALIPATTNVQQVGDCITNTFLCALLYAQTYGHLPSLSLWITFSIVFVMARFATAAVIGGAIFIMLPLYETYLHFTPEMIAIILAFNVILDPLVTCTNVVGNGALSRLFEKIWNRLSVIVQAR